MGGVDDDEPPSKRVKASSLELGDLSNNLTLLEPIVPLGGSMARPSPSQGKEDIIGTKGLIKKGEFVRIITEALYSLGYEKSGAMLEEESGIHLHSPMVSLFRKHVLDGNWDGSVVTLRKIGLQDENMLKSASFLILEQKFFELLEKEKVMDALKTLRSEITPLSINKKRVHELCSCVASPSQRVLLGFANLGIDTSNSRLKLLEELQKLLPPTIMIPERRLEHLVEQALNVQREACFFHNSLDNLSLYTDHNCGKDQIPSRTTQILQSHGDEVWFVQFSNNGKYLASSSNDKSAIIWEFSRHEPGVTHVLVTGGAGYIGSHASLRLLNESYRVTIVDNLSRGNMGAVKILQGLFPEPGRLQFIYADLGDAKAVNKIFKENAFDAVMHFAAVAYVGESTLEPLRYYHNITANTLLVLEAMAAHGVKTLIYSSTCATYGEPKKMPITEVTPQFPINPYGKAKKMAEDIILDYSKNTNMAVMILRYFNVIGSDPEGRLGEAPRPELREHGRISGACFDAALGIMSGLKVKGTNYPTSDGTCVRDYIDVTDLVDAHVKALNNAKPKKVGIYNVGTGKGRSVKEFVEACKKATGVNIKVDYLPRRPGDYAEVYSDPSKINHELNWTATYTDLQKSLHTAWRWQKSHPNGYGSS